MKLCRLLDFKNFSDGCEKFVFVEGKDMYDFSLDLLLLVLASIHYDGKEYIREYDEYLKIMD